jgi:hypothetical protein
MATQSPPPYDVLVHSVLDRRQTVDATLAGYAQDVIAGKVSTAAFFNNFNGLNGFLEGLHNSSVQTGKDHEGNPVYWVQVGSYTLTVKCRKYLANFPDGKPRAPGDEDLHKFTWNGKEYAIAGLAECTISSEKKHVFWNSAHIGMTITHWGMTIGLPAFADIVLTMLKNAAKRLINGFMEITLGTGDANLLAEEAAEGLLVEEEISVAATAACFIGLALIAVGLTMVLFEHETFQNMKLYNLTASDVTWDLKFLHDGTKAIQQPSNDGTHPTFELKGGVPPVPPDDDIIPDSNELIYSEGSFHFKNGHSDRGIYYVMTLTIKGESTPFSFLFDIPFSGDNSLYASFEPLADEKAAEKYYNAHASKNKQLLFEAAGSKYRLSLTFDYLSGKHPMPPDNKEKYYYQSLAVLRSVA